MRYEEPSRDPVARGCQSGTLALGRAIAQAYPELVTLRGAFGCFNRRRVAGSRSWSLHAEGRALDVGVGNGFHDLGWQLACTLVEDRVRYGTMRVMWDGHIWTTERLNEWQQLRPSSEPHRDHVHIEQFWAAARRPQSTAVLYYRALSEARRDAGMPAPPA